MFSRNLIVEKIAEIGGVHFLGNLFWAISCVKEVAENQFFVGLLIPKLGLKNRVIKQELVLMLTNWGWKHYYLFVVNVMRVM